MYQVTSDPDLLLMLVNDSVQKLTFSPITHSDYFFRKFEYIKI